MKKKQRIILTTMSSIAVVSPIAVVVSCNSSTFSNKGYDFGIAISPISNLNYIKYSEVDKVSPTLIQGLILTGPGATLKNKLQLSQFTYSIMNSPDFDDSNGVKHDDGREPTFSGKSGSGIYTLSDYQMFAGNSKGDGLSYLMGRTGEHYLTVSLNGVQRWKGANNPIFNRVVTAQDYVEYVKYATDLNVGSIKITPIKEAKIRGIEDFVIAQENYAAKYKKTYLNPWGLDVVIDKDTNFDTFGNNDEWKKHWSSQNPGDEEFVTKIKDAALKFLLQGMRVSSTGVGNKPDSDLPDTDYSATDFFIRTEASAESSATNLLQDVLQRLLPINKEFVDSIGGIEQFGTTMDKWIYSSPFNIVDSRLGQGGYIDLVKDYNWSTSSYTMANKIKIYFNDDPNVLSAMFEDKYISATDVPGIYQSKFWANPESRQFMSKRNGFGTMGLQLNLDKTVNASSPLQNENFRNAIAHSINRAKLLKLLNWDASFPITTWTPLGGVVKTPDGRQIDDFLSSETFKTPFNDEERSLTASSWMEHTAVRYKFESTNRKDNRLNPTEAQKYIQQYQEETGNKNLTTLTFLAADQVGVNAALGIQTMLEDAGVGYAIKIKLKQVPGNVYSTMRTHGQFDLTTFNFDQYGSAVDSYIKRLFTPDEIIEEKNKYDGFIDNPSASWTFNQWYKEHKTNIEEYAEKYLLISTDPQSDARKIWDKIKIILQKDPVIEDALGSKIKNPDLLDAIGNIWLKQDDLINTDELLFKFVGILEKIIALSSPVIPLLDVDNTWSISRVYGLPNTFSYSLQFAYDVLNRPNPSLPGKDILINESSS